MTIKSFHIIRSRLLFLSLFHRTDPRMNEVNIEAKFSRFLGHNILAEYNSIKCTVAIENKIFGTSLSECKSSLQRKGGNKSKNK